MAKAGPGMAGPGMAGPGMATDKNGSQRNEDLNAEIEQLKSDIAKLARQLQETGQHSYGAARRVASEGMEQMRAQGEAALEQLRANAGDLERRLADTVREKPVTALAIAAGIGFLFAMMSRR